MNNLPESRMFRQLLDERTSESVLSALWTAWIAETNTPTLSQLSRVIIHCRSNSVIYFAWELFQRVYVADAEGEFFLLQVVCSTRVKSIVMKAWRLFDCQNKAELVLIVRLCRNEQVAVEAYHLLTIQELRHEEVVAILSDCEVPEVVDHLWLTSGKQTFHLPELTQILLSCSSELVARDAATLIPYSTLSRGELLPLLTTPWESVAEYVDSMAHTTPCYEAMIRHARASLVWPGQ